MAPASGKLLVSACFAALSFCTSARADEQTGGDAQPIVVPGLFELEVPAEYHWSEAEKVVVENVTARRFTLIKQGASASLILTVEQRQAKDERHRVATIKGYYNGTWKGFKDLGLDSLRGKQPTVTPPIPARVEFDLRGSGTDGQQVYLQSVIIFGQNIFLFVSAGKSQSEVGRLVRIADSLRETAAAKPKLPAE